MLALFGAFVLGAGLLAGRIVLAPADTRVLEYDLVSVATDSTGTMVRCAATTSCCTLRDGSR